MGTQPRQLLRALSPAVDPAVGPAASMQGGRSRFQIKFFTGFGSLLCFGLIRCLVSQQLLIQCCNSITEDHSIVLLVLYVAVFNKPLDDPC